MRSQSLSVSGQFQLSNGASNRARFFSSWWNWSGRFDGLLGVLSLVMSVDDHFRWPVCNNRPNLLKEIPSPNIQRLQHSFKALETHDHAQDGIKHTAGISPL